MPDAPIDTDPVKRRLWLVLLGLGLIVLSPVGWAWTLDDALLQRTGLVMWLVMGMGLAASLVAARGDSRARTRVLATANLVLVSLAVVGFFGLTKLPAPDAFSEVRHIPEFELPDHTGTMRSLADLLRDGSLLLVFYRGHW